MEIPAADLSVRTSPSGCDVLINGKKRGSTNPDGFLNMAGLKPGRYTVIVRKAGYADDQKVIDLYGGTNQQISFALRVGAVPLSVGVNVPGARIEIQSVGSFTGSASTQVQPGRYTVTASKPGYGRASREVDVMVGKPTSLTLTLSRITREEMLAQAEKDFSNRSYTSVIPAGLDLLRDQPDSPRLNSLVGQSYYQSQQFAESVPYLVKAIGLGQQVTLQIKHHKRDGMSLGTLNKLCPGEFTFQQSNFKFSGSCGGFEIPYGKIQALLPEPLKGGRLHIEVGIPDKKGKDKKEDYNFHVYQADVRLIDPPKAANTIVCDAPTCAANVEAIYQILKQLKK
ncbi:MAG: PEGA domain-containing protein [Acidobacteriota bacterium]